MSMFGNHIAITRRTGRRWRVRLFQAATLALAVSMTIPASASDERAIKSRVSPVYPELAKRMKIEGRVKVEATVSSDGKVTAVKTLSGNHMLSPAAEEAVSRWRFAPADAASTVDVDVNFALAQ
ncbi:MAG TPA: energy transducer TonB [Terracidiphilus sp.]|jgi:TonB family protein